MRIVRTNVIYRIDRGIERGMRKGLRIHIQKCRDTDLDPARLPPELARHIMYEGDGRFGLIERKLRKEYREGLFVSVGEFEGKKAVVEEMLDKIGVAEEHKPIALEVMRMLFRIAKGRPVSIHIEDNHGKETVGLQCHEVEVRIHQSSELFCSLMVFCEGVFGKTSAPRPEYRDAKVIRFQNLRENMEGKINRLMDPETLYRFGANAFSIEYDVADVGGLGRYNKQCQVQREEK